MRSFPRSWCQSSGKGLLDMANSILETISSEFASAAEKVGGSVVAVHARRWLPTSGIEWKKGVVVTVHHGVQRDEDIKVLLDGGHAISAKLAGRDPRTDIAVIRIEERSSSAPQLGDSTSLRLGHLVLALGRTRRGDLVASSGIIGGISGEWRNRRGDNSISTSGSTSPCTRDFPADRCSMPEARLLASIRGA